MEKNIKIFIFYTDNIKYLVDLLLESTLGIEDAEFIPVHHNVIYNNCELGKLGGEGYLEMCLHNHLTKLEIIKNNLGNNIILIDADIVFNNKLNFVKIVNDLLIENDFLFQFDDNSIMSSSINLGITAVKCSDNSLNFWQSHCDLISNIPKHERNAGFPQVELNNLIMNEYWGSKIKYKILPKTFGFDVDGSYCYHAIAVHNKLDSLQTVLNKWKNN